MYCERVVGSREHSLEGLKEKGFVTADQGGHSSASEVVDMALGIIGRVTVVSF